MPTKAEWIEKLKDGVKRGDSPAIGEAAMVLMMGPKLTYRALYEIAREVQPNLELGQWDEWMAEQDERESQDEPEPKKEPPGQVWLTNAPQAYDYGCCTTVGEVKDPSGKVWRRIVVSDAYRFENYQRPRYGSGLYQAYREGSPDAKERGLS